MLKSIAAAAAVLTMAATPVAAGEWEALAVSDAAVVAVDWSSVSVRAPMRRVTYAMVPFDRGSAPFDYAVSTMDMDCSQPRYTTLSSNFYDRGGNALGEGFVGDGSWIDVAPDTLMSDVRREVCGDISGRQGYFDTAHEFAVNAWRIVENQ